MPITIVNADIASIWLYGSLHRPDDRLGIVAVALPVYQWFVIAGVLAVLLVGTGLVRVASVIRTPSSGKPTVASDREWGKIV